MSASSHMDGLPGWVLRGAIVGGLLIGCAHASEITRAQDPLPMATIALAGEIIQVEVADEDTERQVGLMFRKEMPPDQGMLFIYPDQQLRSFWMKNTFLPLSIAYLDEAGRIVHIADMAPHDVSPVPSVKPAKYALEMNQGWFDRHTISVGEQVSGLPAVP